MLIPSFWWVFSEWPSVINIICSEELITDGRTGMVSSHQTFQRNSYVRRCSGSNSDRWRVSLDCWPQAAQFCAFWGLSTHLASFVAVLIFPVFPGLGSFNTALPCCCLVAQSYPTLRDLMDCSLEVPLVCGISQARIPQWVATSFSRRFSRTRDWACVSCLVGGFFYHRATREAPSQFYLEIHLFFNFFFFDLFLVAKLSLL